MARKYPEASRTAYQAAARTLRCPYWDWASSPSLPRAVTAPSFHVNTHDGPRNLRNPLYSYQFQVFPFTDADFAADLAQFNETKRCTDKRPDSDGANNFGESSGNLTEDFRIMREQVVSRPLPSPNLPTAFPFSLLLFFHPFRLLCPLEG